ncbi:uncharacterized protein [Lolium perenne]|uniref:uncharacterized protein isoform X1 n=1 Tax=Lolium perenne TaxID=4522 RepID=UPI003A9909CB
MWDAIAAAVPGKTPEDVRRHYELLVEDVDGIEAGRVPLLVYAGDAGPDDGGGSGGGGGKKGSGVDKGSSKSAEQERRKGIAWTEDEHRCPCASATEPSACLKTAAASAAPGRWRRLRWRARVWRWRRRRGAWRRRQRLSSNPRVSPLSPITTPLAVPVSTPPSPCACGGRRLHPRSQLLSLHTSLSGTAGAADLRQGPLPGARAARPSPAGTAWEGSAGDLHRSSSARWIREGDGPGKKAVGLWWACSGKDRVGRRAARRRRRQRIRNGSCHSTVSLSLWLCKDFKKKKNGTTMTCI